MVGYPVGNREGVSRHRRRRVLRSSRHLHTCQRRRQPTRRSRRSAPSTSRRRSQTKTDSGHMTGLFEEVRECQRATTRLTVCPWYLVTVCFYLRLVRATYRRGDRWGLSPVQVCIKLSGSDHQTFAHLYFSNVLSIQRIYISLLVSVDLSPFTLQ